MFLRCKVRRKDGKQHRYWSVVENTRVGGGRVVQRHVLYLGEINDTQELAWRRSIAVLEDGAAQPRTLSLFPEDRCEGLLADASIVRVKLSELRLRRPRQWGACWLALLLWRELQLDQFWCKRLGVSRKATRWDQVLFVLVAYRLLAPGSEWRLHREWEQAIRRRQLKRLWARLKQLSTMEISREELLMKLGAARDQSRSAWRLVVIKVAADSATFTYWLDRNKLRQARSREGRYLLRTNLVEEDPAKLWSQYLLLVAVEEAFKNLKACPCEGGGRPRDPADLSPARGPHRGARLHRLPGLLPARHSCAALACAGARADAAQCAGEVRRCADDRCAPPDHRRPRAGAHPLYRARTRAQPPAEEAETGAARPTTTQNHRQRACATHPDVVPTFGGPHQQSQTLRYLRVFESAKLG